MTPTSISSGAQELADVDLFQLRPRRRLDAIRATRPRPGVAVGLGPRLDVRARSPAACRRAQQLDAVVPDRPAYMRCYDGHTGWVNTRRAGARRHRPDTPDPPNGRIVRDGGGEPTGALKEDAQALVECGTSPSPPRPKTGPRSGRRSPGSTGRASPPARTPRSSLDELALWRRILDEDGLPLRVRLALSWTRSRPSRSGADRLDAYEAPAFPLRGGERLDAGILKGFVDGVIEARTASMLAPYEGDTGAGLPNWEPDQLDAFVAEADRRGWQVELHAIGDRGIRMALDAYERAATRNGPWTGDPHGPACRRGPTRAATASSTSRPSIPPTSRASASWASSPRCSRYHADPVAQPDRRCGPGTSARSGRAGPGRGGRSSRRAGGWRSAPTGRSCRSTRSARSTARSTARRWTACRRAAGSPESGCR